MTDVLRDATVRQDPSLFEIGRPVAVKTAQGPQPGEFWAVGYTPQRVVVLWMGGERLSERPVSGLWLALMQAASRNAPAEDWPRPAGVVRLNVCDPSGLLPTEACPNQVTETFIDGYQPMQPDSLYRAYAINRETGLLATIFTPPALIEKRVYLQIPAQAQEWATAVGIQSPPDTYDTIRPPRFSPSVNIVKPALFEEQKGKVSVIGTAAGQDFVSYRLVYGQGLNPSGWVLIAESNRPVEAATLAEWDTTGLNGLYVLQLVVLRTENRIETASTLVMVDNEPPHIALEFPKNGTNLVLAEQPQIVFQPRVSDNFHLTRVEVWLDGRQLAAFDAPPFTLTWNARRGQHTLRILARDRLGHETTLDVTFSVK